MNISGFNLLNDIYYSPDFARLYLQEDCEIYDFKYAEGDKVFYNLAIKRPISSVGKETFREIYYDLSTPYGYGGYFANCADRAFVMRAMAEYTKKCLADNVIAEFLRFHQFNSFPQAYADMLDFCSFDRKTVFIGMDDDYEQTRKRYKGVLRTDLAKAQRNGLHFEEMEKNLENIKSFLRLYYKTMRHRKADKFYFFGIKYFEEIFQMPNVKLFGVKLDEKLTNALIILESFPFIYYHLSGNDPEYYPLCGNALALDSVVRHYHRKAKIFYLGGGATKDEQDSLLKFKQKFSDTSHGFHIGGKIFNPEKYHEYTANWRRQRNEVQYFLKYRLPV
ncbi:MAG: hypothetical protein A2X49_02050 [Lentisphaerae bacterium GWF2_52_8]|nr:MAG: hypothetical protein A2X49_02050 [Lentisphaerae bacterium GWF2_52_8]